MPAPPPPPDPRAALVTDPELRVALVRMVRGRAAEADVDDIVQATLADALAGASAPEDPAELRKWVFGIARHKIVDHHRRASRVELEDSLPEVEATSAPHGANDLLRWVKNELPDDEGAKKTLEWMAREADGDDLESIAAEENLPAPRVRQRVSRLRRLLRERWAIAMAVVTLVVIAGGISLWRGRLASTPPMASTSPAPSAPDRALALRDAALELCRQRSWRACLDGLDQARVLDPAGDQAEVIREARAAARRAEVAPPASATPEPAPSARLAPPAPTAPPPKAPRRGKSTRGSSLGSDPGSSGP
jgi:DNA-directed RNA polymerase specialized sigma24 family protein